jgi:hypothetical protein
MHAMQYPVEEWRKKACSRHEHAAVPGRATQELLAG